MKPSTSSISAKYSHEWYFTFHKLHSYYWSTIYWHDNVIPTHFRPNPTITTTKSKNMDVGTRGMNIIQTLFKPITKELVPKQKYLCHLSLIMYYNIYLAIDFVEASVQEMDASVRVLCMRKNLDVESSILGSITWMEVEG